MKSGINSSKDDGVGTVGRELGDIIDITTNESHNIRLGLFLEEIRPDCSRVDRERALDVSVLLESDGVQNIGRLGLSVGISLLVGLAIVVAKVVKVDFAEVVTVGGDVHDGTAGRRSLELWEENHGELEVAHMVGGELRLDAVDGGGVGVGHDSGVVDENVEVGNVIEGVGGLGDLLEGG